MNDMYNRVYELVGIVLIHFILEYLALNGSIDVHILIIENFVRKNRGYSDDNFRKKKKKKNYLHDLRLKDYFFLYVRKRVLF